ncbi:hypothetical protein SPFM6_00042 [Salmonella phage SPFM6]|nr:hypothetical protein SPFM6_00042 [Salmonella phage SPFM6]
MGILEDNRLFARDEVILFDGSTDVSQDINQNLVEARLTFDVRQREPFRTRLACPVVVRVQEPNLLIAPVNLFNNTFPANRQLARLFFYPCG